MTWYKIKLTPQQCANFEMGKIQDEFFYIWALNGSPKEMKIYSANILKNVKDNGVMYFTPLAAEKMKEILSKYNPEPCEKPKEDSIISLVED